jgi:hypothetical protein
VQLGGQFGEQLGWTDADRAGELLFFVDSIAILIDDRNEGTPRLHVLPLKVQDLGKGRVSIAVRPTRLVAHHCLRDHGWS